ncbi:feruloyl-CoA synthase [uncultured Bradyrhizobium sp.]|uniref:feruloyl-CoA synthase n=1 Tax=uncultured Bradyrhizobium sp. TaxID=199684 RepID=UPI0035CC8141
MYGAAGRRDDPETLFAAPAVVAERYPDGSIRLKSTTPLQPAARCVGDWLEHWARQTPDRIFLGERSGVDAPWTTVTYGEALRQVRSTGAWILSQRMSADRPLAVLSDNSIEHALLALGAMHVGVPVAAISPAYSLMSKDFDKLKSMIALLDPGAIYVSSLKTFAPALAAIEPLHAAAIVSRDADGKHAISFGAIGTAPETDAVARSFAALTPDTIAKFLFTSGSTGTPKAVINTQRMLTSSQQAKAQTWSFLEHAQGDLVILDWLPWSHTFGANHNFNLVLRNGGTLYIDGGKPVPGLFATSLANMRSVMPTVYFNVPRGFDMLIAALRDDEDLRRRFFTEVKFAFYAGAALPQNLWDALADLSIGTVGRAMPMVSAWGSTETSPLATDCHFQAERSGNIGVPIPGTELKLVRSGDKLEVRVRGPNVTPGYWKAPGLTATAFDADGFYLIGDAVTFADPDRPERGLFFDGRVTEDFKLNSGTWVSVGTLRVAGIAALAPLAQDIVVTGHGGDHVRFLVFPDVAACRAHAGLADDAGVNEVIGSEQVRTAIAQGLARLKARGAGSSTHATRALLLSEPASVDGGEITDKGYINQRAVLTRRAAAVAMLEDDACAEWIGCPA